MLISPRRLALRTLKEVRDCYPVTCKRGSARFVVARNRLEQMARRAERASPHCRDQVLPIYRDAIALLTR